MVVRLILMPWTYALLEVCLLYCFVAAANFARRHTTTIRHEAGVKIYRAFSFTNALAGSLQRAFVCRREISELEGCNCLYI
jgi:hypothetical protein